MPFAELQAISYSVSREKAPIYTMGSADPRAYSRNKRGIAGTLIWINFDRHALLDVFWKTAGKFVANTDDVRPQFQMLTDAPQANNAIFNSSLTRTVPGLSLVPLSKPLARGREKHRSTIDTRMLRT